MMSDSRSLPETVAELADVLAALEPQIQPQLRPPATREHIRQAEQALGFEFPAELRNWLECHDGQHFYSDDRGYGDPIVPMMTQSATGQFYSHYWFCGTREIVDYTRYFRQEFEEYYRDETFETYGPARHHDKYLVITASENADVLVLDLLPEPGGTVGQVLLYCTQPYQIAVVSDSLGTFLRDLVSGYQSGRFKFDSDQYFVSYCER